MVKRKSNRKKLGVQRKVGLTSVKSVKAPLKTLKPTTNSRVLKQDKTGLKAPNLASTPRIANSSPSIPFPEVTRI